MTDPLPSDIAESFGALNATLIAVQDVIEDVIERKDALRARINQMPGLCVDGEVGSAHGYVIDESGWAECVERLELIAAMIGEGRTEAGRAVPVPTWYVQRRDERTRFFGQLTEDRAGLARRVRELERVVFDLTTASTD